MDWKLFTEIVIGAFTALMAGGAFWNATRAQGQQAKAANAAVDADAYTRAQRMYESVITTLDAEIHRLRSEISALHIEIGQIRDEVRQLRHSNLELTAEVASLRNH
jgi:predicted RNase H-like nuclease (RuvC/YqgF family)